MNVEDDLMEFEAEKDLRNPVTSNLLRLLIVYVSLI